jgi:hypothetical protein
MSLDIQNFLEQVNKELKFDEYRERFIEELEDHVEDGVHERLLQGIKEEKAYQETLTQVGEVRKLASIYNFIILTMKMPLSVLKKILIVLTILTITLPLITIGGTFVMAYFNTTYAPRYSWSGFRSVHSGMLFKQTVQERIGEPLQIDYYGEDKKIEVWRYTEPKISTDWYIRKVIFYEDTVIGVVRETYFD